MAGGGPGGAGGRGAGGRVRAGDVGRWRRGGGAGGGGGGAGPGGAGGPDRPGPGRCPVSPVSQVSPGWCRCWGWRRRRWRGTRWWRRGWRGRWRWCRALGDAGVGAPLWVLTCGAVAAGPGEVLASPVQAQVWGLGRVAGLEHPGRWGGLVDVPPVLDERAGSWLCGVLAGCGEDQVAVREAGVLARRLVRAASRAGQGRRWVPGGTVLVTGGTGAIGAASGPVAGGAGGAAGGAGVAVRPGRGREAAAAGGGCGRGWVAGGCGGV